MGEYVSLSEDTLPQLADWGTGQSYEITMRVKMVSKSEGDEWGDGDGGGVRGRFKILSASGPSDRKGDRMAAMKERLKS